MIDFVLAAVAAFAVVGLLLASGLFASSLLPGATPLLHRFAQAEDPDTARRPLARRYLWWLTVLWATVLFAGACIVARRVAGELVLSPSVGVVAPLGLAAILFFGERLVRRRVFGEQSVGPVARQWRVASRILKEEALRRLSGGFLREEPVILLADDRREVIVWRDSQCSATRLQSAAVDLAASFPPGQRVLVVCEDRAVFLWAVLAAWAARRTVVLPPADLKHAPSSAQHSEFECVVTDRTQVAGAGDLPTLRIDDGALRRALGNPRSSARRITLPWSHVAAVFFTSGSTGRPTAQAKSWRQLAQAAGAMVNLLPPSTPGRLFGGTVVHSHMFGFEMLVMQVLRGAAALYAHRIVYPSDLAAFAAMEHPRKWLVTTPYHLEVFAGSEPLPGGLERIVSATMPLDPALAEAVESSAGAQVHEIYGSTEAGCIATRRPISGLAWRLAADLELEVRADGSVILHGARLGDALALRDRIARTTHGFELSGRDTDLVKVAGKRTSLEALNAILREIDGVEDGVFIDGATIGQRRLAAVVVAPGLSIEHIREVLATRIDAAFLPRPLVQADTLPRDANGKLPLDALVASVSLGRRKQAPAMVEALHSHVG